MGNRFGFVCALLALGLAGCGGGGGTSSNNNGSNNSGNGTNPPPAAVTHIVGGTISGLDGTVVLQNNGGNDLTIDADADGDGEFTFSTAVSNGAAYSVTVLTQPQLGRCTVGNGQGAATADVSNVTVTCTKLTVSLNISAPANDSLVPIDSAQNITASFANITADRITWTVLPEGQAANVTLTQASSTASSAVMEFEATSPGTYTVRATSQDDTSKTADITLRVHQVYAAIDGYVQQRTYLQADGRVRSKVPGAPMDVLKAIAQGYLFGAAVRSDGTVVSWGNNITAPVPTGLSQVKQVVAGDYFSMAIQEDGTLTVWGKRNSDAKLPPSLTAAKFKAVDATNSQMAGIQEDGTLVVWDGDTGNLVTTPAAWQDKKFTQVCGTEWHIVAVDEAGTLYSWNGVNTGDPAMSAPPVTSNVAAVYCGSEHAALVQTDGRVMTWGERLGSGGPFDSNAVDGFPRIKGAAFYSYAAPRFLTESGAVIDTTANLVTSIDNL